MMGVLRFTAALVIGSILVAHVSGAIRTRFVPFVDEAGDVHMVDAWGRSPYNGWDLMNVSDVTVWVYSRANPNFDEGISIPAEGFTGRINTPYFDPARRTVITVHGWMGTRDSSTNRVTKDGYLARCDCNVLVLDYARPANLFYTYAAAIAQPTGVIGAEFVNKMLATYAMSARSIDLVGQSLGGQVIGVMGALIRDAGGSKVDAIVALDPAGPLFDALPEAERLDRSDGEYVQVIHTNTAFLGFGEPCGHADFYPNDRTMSQPGCGPDVFGECAHYRAYWYYGESLLTGGFRARRCPTYDDYLAGRDCDHDSYMGEYPLDKEASGIYWLSTNPDEPYAAW